MKVGVYAKVINSVFLPSLNELFNSLNRLKAHIWIYPQLIDIISKQSEIQFPLGNIITGNDTPHDLDFIITIGGDGTFLEALSAIKTNNIPCNHVLVSVVNTLNIYLI